MSLRRNLLFYGDNLDVLRNRIPSGSVDLVYLDPPFNSNRSYNVLFRHRSGAEAQAQIEAFDDTWIWTQESEQLYRELLQGGAPAKVADALEAMRKLLGDNDLLAYLTMMSARMVELHRVLKPTGSLYLHCDPTASHYLKLLLDAVFGPEQFRSEIIWKRTTAHSDTAQGRRQHGRVHDLLFFYTKGDKWTWNPLYTSYDPEYVASKYRYVEPETGRLYRLGDLTGPGGAAKGNPAYEVMGVTRHWRYSKENMEALIKAGRVVQTKPGAVPQYKRYLDEMPGVPIQDIWADIDPINSMATERLGYPTQKPEALLERIIAASSSEGDVVLDPFCGCGTAIAVAQRLNRRWIGVDVTYLAVDLIRNRLRGVYGEAIEATYVVDGIPADEDSARALFAASPFDFERWAVSLVDGTPNERQVGDRGVDGVVRFPLDARGGVGRALVSVKGGKLLNPGMVRDLVGTVGSQRAEMGLLITLERPTRGMEEAARHSGTFTWPVNHQPFPMVQLLTVGDLLSGQRPKMPTPFLPYIQAKRLAAPSEQLTLG
jgi:DNA modification methylase